MQCVFLSSICLVDIFICISDKYIKYIGVSVYVYVHARACMHARQRKRERRGGNRWGAHISGNPSEPTLLHQIKVR